MPVAKQINKHFFKEWSPETAYALGFFFADGSLDVNPRGGHYFSLQTVDYALLQAIRSVMDSEHKISKRIGKDRSHIWYRMQVGSKVMCSDLRTLGVDEAKAKTMCLPKLPASYTPDFIRGYFDGDGNVWFGNIHKDRDTQTPTLLSVFTSCSANFLVGLRAELQNYGLGRGSLYKRKNAYKLQYSVNDSLLLYKLMYDNLQNDLYLPRKKKVYEAYIHMRA